MNSLSEPLLLVWHVVEALLVIYAVYRGTKELRERIADLMGKLHNAEYRVKWTSIKDLIRDDHTEFIKLRMLRVYNDVSILSIDTEPCVVDSNKALVASNLYSIPGRADINPEGKIDIRFSSDEHLKPYSDRVVLIGYSLNEKIDAMYEPPGVLVVQPVGQESLVYEAHFPPGRHYERVDGEPNKPKILVYTDRTQPLARDKYRAEGGHFDFGDGLGKVDWLRVTIPKPPQDKDVSIDWFWQKPEEAKI